MTKPQSERFNAVHELAMTEFRDSQNAVRDVREQCLEDRRFASISGAQWEGPLGEQFENKPKIEVNKTHLSVMRLVNEYRNNRITVDYISKDGEEADALADTCDGLYRADEQDSVADEAYDNAYEEAVTGGFGAWRLRAHYEDEEEDDDRQRVRFEPIYDADTCVFFDVNAKRQDKSDAKHCFVLTSQTASSFIAEFDMDPASFPKDINEHFEWVGVDFVYVAEYYVIEEKKATILFFEHLDGSEEKITDITEEVQAQMDGKGAVMVRSKKITKKKVRKYLLCGSCVLEDCGYIAGPHIPIIPCYGQRWFVSNVERCMGHVRLAKDAQRLKNMQLSKLAETSAFGGMETPIFTPEQVAGHEESWRTRNTTNPAYLLVNALEGPNGEEMPSGPLGHTIAPTVPQATAAILQIIEQDLMDILGNGEAGEEMPSGISGKAVELIQNRLDMQSFIYMSNFAKAVQRCGVVWLGMANELYVERGRKMKSIGRQDEMDSVVLMRPVLNKDTGATEYENDMSRAKYDVVADVGPSSSSRRAATVRGLTGMMSITQDPETLQVLSAMSMMNMEGEGIKDVRNYFRKKLVAMGVLDPTDAEQEEMEAAQQGQQEPNAQDQFLMAEAAKAQSEIGKVQAETTLKEAQTQKTEAETAETMAGIPNAERESAAKFAKDMRDAMSP